MKIIYRILLVVSASFAVVQAYAQNLDPTVEVNRAYEGKLLEVHKPVLEMALPDSVQQFDLDFDYDVFNNPYKGSYDFRPYELLLKPFATEMEMSVFRLKAGAGYSLYPQLDMVWSPIRKGNFKMNVYVGHKSYFGDYRMFSPEEDGSAPIKLTRWKGDGGERPFWKGYRMNNEAGIDGRLDWKKGLLAFDVAYNGIGSKDTLKRNLYNSFDGRLLLSSKPSGDNYFHYKVTAAYSMGGSGLKYADALKKIDDRNLEVGAEFGMVVAKAHRLLFDLGLDMASAKGMIDASVSEYSITPHYVFNKGKLNVDLGVKLAKLVVPEGALSYASKGQFVYPDVKIRWSMAPEVIGVYLFAGGGNVVNTYRSVLERNPFVEPTMYGVSPLLDVTVGKLSARLGFDGKIMRRFAYDVHLGYSDVKSGLMDAVFLQNGNYLPGMAYASYRKVDAGVDWAVRGRSLTLDGNVSYNYYIGLEDVANVFAPAVFTGDAAFEYNWNRRIFFGVDCAFSSARHGKVAGFPGAAVDTMTEVTVPGYADLGITMEYAMSRRFSFWMRGGNLLNMTVQYAPLNAERGINFTAGICLKL